MWPLGPINYPKYMVYFFNLNWSIRIRLSLVVKFVLVRSFSHHVSFVAALESVSANMQDRKANFSHLLTFRALQTSALEII
jgi:Mn-containing catalase